jgi:hypothetical protein
MISKKKFNSDLISAWVVTASAKDSLQWRYLLALTDAKISEKVVTFL